MSPDSLIRLCLLEITRLLPHFKDDLLTLPRSIKSALLRIAYYRNGILENIEILQNLLHPDVEIINFINCNVTDEMMECISICHNLRALKFRGSKNLTKEACISLFPNFPNLMVLSAIKCSAIDDEVMHLIVKSCPNITTLNIHSTGVTSVTLGYICHLRLRSLNIKGFYISDDGINRFLSGVCRDYVEEFYFTDCSYESYENVIKKCANLTTIIGTKIFEHHALAGTSVCMRPTKQITFIL